MLAYLIRSKAQGASSVRKSARIGRAVSHAKSFRFVDAGNLVSVEKRRNTVVDLACEIRERVDRAAKRRKSGRRSRSRMTPWDMFGQLPETVSPPLFSYTEATPASLLVGSLDASCAVL